MLVMYGNNGVLVIALTEQHVEQLKSSLALTYEGAGIPAFPTKSIIVMYGQDKADVIAQVEAAGVEVTEEYRQAWMDDERIARERKQSN